MTRTDRIAAWIMLAVGLAAGILATLNAGGYYVPIIHG